MVSLKNTFIHLRHNSQSLTLPPRTTNMLACYHAAQICCRQHHLSCSLQLFGSHSRCLYSMYVRKKVRNSHVVRVPGYGRHQNPIPSYRILNVQVRVWCLGPVAMLHCTIVLVSGAWCLVPGHSLGH
jgi:hypothetical protein